MTQAIEETAAAAVRLPQPVGPGAPATVLVVDDEPRNLEVISHFLAAEGLLVLTAEDGEAALRAVAEHTPDLVLLDVVMPPPDGYEVCRRLKDNPATAFIPVVILTALRGVQERVKGAAAGADEFLTKPFEPVELITRARALLRAKRLHDQLQAYSAELEQHVAERTAALQHALDELRQLDRMKSEFIATVSHELRTPLLHVKGYVDLLADGAMGELTAKQAEGLGVAQAAIERLEGVVSDIVDFSSLHEARLTFEPVYVADVCRNVIQAAGPVASRHRTSIRLSTPPEATRALADRVALTRVLRHLLDNAIKFGPPGQVVHMMIERREAKVRLAVRDQGPGLAPAQVQRVFEAFYQVDGSSTRRAGGLGMGLALVRRLVEAHGSQVNVSSEPGRGSMFFFDLPAA